MHARLGISLHPHWLLSLHPMCMGRIHQWRSQAKTMLHLHPDRFPSGNPNSKKVPDDWGGRSRQASTPWIVTRCFFFSDLVARCSGKKNDWYQTELCFR